MQIIKNHITKKEKYNIAFDQLEEILGFSKNKIENVECFDVSHISQSNAVTSCVVYSRNGAQKNQYRLFNVPKNIAGDDLLSLENALLRRSKKYFNINTRPSFVNYRWWQATVRQNCKHIKKNES